MRKMSTDYCYICPFYGSRCDGYGPCVVRTNDMGSVDAGDYRCRGPNQLWEHNPPLPTTPKGIYPEYIILEEVI
jgi:hypothetical protein